MPEAKRGCGFRQVGGSYLVGSGFSIPCDALPFEIRFCPQCGYRPPFSRAIVKLNKGYFNFEGNRKHREEGKCSCPPTCPICGCIAKDLSLKPEYYGLMWVGEMHYTPESFIEEAKEMGVSKRISKIPKWLKLGETWVVLAHKKVKFYDEGHLENGMAKAVPVEREAVFYAFRPQRIEKLIWKHQATKKKLEQMEKQGFTPVVIPDGEMQHAPTERKRRRKK